MPPTVQAHYKGEMTGLQLWVLDCTELKELNEKNLHAPDPAKWAYQLNRLHAFEDLVANLDKNEGTPIVDPQRNLIVLDHSLAFTNTLALPYEIGKKLNQIDRPFFDRIKALDKPTVQRAIGALVDAGALGRSVRSTRQHCQRFREASGRERREPSLYPLALARSRR